MFARWLKLMREGPGLLGASTLDTRANAPDSGDFLMQELGGAGEQRKLRSRADLHRIGTYPDAEADASMTSYC
jgi:hypothetical protein